MYEAMRHELSARLKEEQQVYFQHWFSSSAKPSPERVKDYLFRETLATQLEALKLDTGVLRYLLSLPEPLTVLCNSMRNRYDVRVTAENME